MTASENMDWQLVDAIVFKKDDYRAKHLLEKGASVNARSGWNETVLMTECFYHNKEMVDFLLKRGAAIDETDCAGLTALMIASQIGDVEIFDLLLENHADVMKKSREGQTAIHHAAINNHKTILDRLLCYTGLTVDINDDLGRTPLWWAAEAGHLDSVDILLLHGANPDPDPDPGNKSNMNQSPVGIARSKGYNAIVSMMTEKLQSPSRQYAISVVKKLKEKIGRQERQINELNEENKRMQEELRHSAEQKTEETRLRADLDRKDDLIKQLLNEESTWAQDELRLTAEQETEVTGLRADLQRLDNLIKKLLSASSSVEENTVVKSSDVTVEPVSSVISAEITIGPQGGKFEFPSSDVFLIVPQGAIPSATTFLLKTYVALASLPPVTSIDEVPLSPAFHVSSSFQQGQHFTKPIQLSLPVQVPLKANDGDSGWLLQLKRSCSSDSLPGEWHTVVKFNTQTGEIVSQSSFVHYDHASGTVGLDHFCWFAWLGSKLGFNSQRTVDYAVFGRQVQKYKWEVAVHIIHKSKVVYEQLVRRLRNGAYVELKQPNTDCIRYLGEVSVNIRCEEPWRKRVGELEGRINASRIWGCQQDDSCYHEVTVEDRSCTADALECTVTVSFRPEGDTEKGYPVVLPISHPLELQVGQQTLDVGSIIIVSTSTREAAGAAALPLPAIPDSEGGSNNTSAGDRPSCTDGTTGEQPQSSPKPAPGDQYPTSQHVGVVARCCSEKWRAMGRVLLHCDSNEVNNTVSGLSSMDTDSEKLRCIIEEWLRRTVEATVTQLVETCNHPDINCQGIVVRKLKEAGLL